MATYTPNYNLRKIDLTDAPPDITALNNNWDIVDGELHDVNEELQNINNQLENIDEYSVKVVSISLPKSGWSGTNVFSQRVTISGTTSKSKVDLQPNSTVLLQLIDDGVSALYVANNNGVLTVYAVGAAPTIDLTVQATVMEVE
jgi:hypothetical protein